MVTFLNVKHKTQNYFLALPGSVSTLMSPCPPYCSLISSLPSCFFLVPFFPVQALPSAWNASFLPPPSHPPKYTQTHTRLIPSHLSDVSLKRPFLWELSLILQTKWRLFIKIFYGPYHWFWLYIICVFINPCLWDQDHFFVHCIPKPGPVLGT